MIIYEVNLTVDPDVADEYAAWLRPHIAHILEIDGFLGAEWLERDAVDENGDSEKVRWTIQYRLCDRAALEAYQRDHADAHPRRAGALLRPLPRQPASAGADENLQPQPKYG